MIVPGRDSCGVVAPARRTSSRVGTALGWWLDNCYSDYAQTNAQQLIDLLAGMDAESD